jgi:hypothetical protein
LRQPLPNLLIHLSTHYHHTIPIFTVNTIAQTSCAVIAPVETIEDIFSCPLPIMAWCGHQLPLMATVTDWWQTPWMGTQPWIWISARPEGALIILECHMPSIYILRPCNGLLRVFSLDFPCKVFTFLVKIVYSI